MVARRRGSACVRAAGVAALVATMASWSSATPGSRVLERFWSEQKAPPTASEQALVGVEFMTTIRDRVAKAAPDECFVAIGDAGNVPIPPGGCVSGQPKVNQAYVWSMTEDDNGSVWFGTVANTQCWVTATYLGAVVGFTSGPTIQTDSWVCEFNGPSGPGSNPLGDLRPPKIYRWDPTARTLTEENLQIPLADLPLLAATVGIRAAGTHGGVMFFGGPGMLGGVNLFAFDATTGSYLGATALAGYTDIRRFAVFGNALYAGVGAAIGGEVWRWTGSAGDPFSFATVGVLPGEIAAELAVHEGRLFVGTWPMPYVMAPGQTAGVWMSPDPGSDGVLDPVAAPNDDSGTWSKVWQAGKLMEPAVPGYEPDPVTAAVYGVGAMASFGGSLYWGTMHVPFLATLAHATFYSGFYDSVAETDDVLALLLGTHRATAIFRGSGFTTTPSLELLYGMPVLPVFTPPVPPPPPSPAPSQGVGVSAADPTQTWSLQPTGWTPTFGLAGMGNLFNNYTWAMAVNDGRLWIGTMDWSYLLFDAGETILRNYLETQQLSLGDLLAQLDPQLPQLLQQYAECLNVPEDLPTTMGADLFYVPADGMPAYPESLAGVGNYTSYGVRNLLSVNGTLYAGMANPMNLLTDGADDVPEGGWELIALTDVPPNTPAGQNVQVTLPDGSTVGFCSVGVPGYTAGLWVPMPCCGMVPPPPDGYPPSDRALLVGSSAGWSPCSSSSVPPTLANVCIPDTTGGGRVFQLQLVDGPDGLLPAWVDVTTSRSNGMVCGGVRYGYQDLVAAVGFPGYIGVVTLLEGVPPIPAMSVGGIVGLLLLVAVVGLLAVRMRMS